jgi:hypothetical protein
MIKPRRFPALVALAVLAVPGLAAAQAELAASTRALVDAFQAHCLANLADLDRLRAVAAARGYTPVPPAQLGRLNAGEAWILPTPEGEVVLGLSPAGACGTSTRHADPGRAVSLLKRRVALRPLGGAAARASSFGVVYRGREATLRVAGFTGEHQGAVSLTLAPGPPAATPAPPAAATAALPLTLPPNLAPALAPPGRGPRIGDSAIAGTLPLPPIARPRAPPPAPPAPPPTGPAAAIRPPALESPAWDPSATSVENLAAAMFDDVCTRTRNDRQAIERKARSFGWQPIDKQATIRAGFDLGWQMRAPGGGTLMVFFDPLAPRCCVSAFPARRRFLTAAIGTRHGLGQPRERRVGQKQVLSYRPRDNYQITLDFEEVENRGTFASVCYTRR